MLVEWRRREGHPGGPAGGASGGGGAEGAAGGKNYTLWGSLYSP